MTDAPEKQQAAAGAATAATQMKDNTKAAPNSPARSDKSSDSEGKTVREKLKDTQIDARIKPNPMPKADQSMNDGPNGSAKGGEQSVSGSDSERGRLRRKRSREDFEDDAEGEKQPEKKVERHQRKRSRDITKDEIPGIPPKPVSPTIVEEKDADEHMTSPNKTAASTTTADKASGSDRSPKNKRTRDQVEKDTETASGGSEAVSANGKPVDKTGEERDKKRLRDKEDIQTAADAVESKTKIPPGSGFANTSAASPFAAMAPIPQASKSSGKPESLPQTSDDKFKSSGFGGFATAASPFGGLASTKPSMSTSSPFGAASGSKLSSFAGSIASTTSTGGGFGSLGTPNTTSGFGGTSFGGSPSGGFGGFASTKPALSFASPGAGSEIKGLSKSQDVPFGAATIAQESDEDEEGEEGTENDTDKEERQTTQPLLSQQPQETGEEGEETQWAGRAKLYTMAGEGTSRAWKERGIGTFKFNITLDEPKRARFVLRAEGTHRLLLNAAVTRNMVFGGDAQGEKPKDTRLLFNSPTPEGELEMHLLKLKAENAQALWEKVTEVQEELL